MTFSLREYMAHDATGLAQLVRKREVSAAELLEVAIELQRRTHADINAVNHLMLDEAHRVLQRLDPSAPFAGVPFLLKDLLSAYAGEPMSCGSAALRHWIPSRHSFVTERFLRAGFVPFGKTSTPECGLLGTTEPEAFGPTRNPWNLQYSSGGSSGGSSAAVAARVVPVASAGDGGGSIRIPASVCGLFGLKPSRGRVSNGPHVSESWCGAVSQHVISRSVRDSASILDLLAGYQPGDPYSAPDPDTSFASALSREPRRLRIAVASSIPHGITTDADSRHAVVQCSALLTSMGHEVEVAEPDIDLDQLLDDYLLLYFGAVAADLGQWEEWLGGVSVDQLVEPATLLLRRVGQRLPVERVERAHRRWNDYAREMARFHEHFDAYVLPVTAACRWRLGSMALGNIEKSLIRTADRLRLRMFFTLNRVHSRSRMMQALVPFTQLANLTGQPAMSVPVHWCGDGFPVGVQVVGRYGDEHTLLALARQIEAVQPWAERLPGIVGNLC